MRLEERYRQLIRIAGIIILFLLLLGVLSIYFSGNDPVQKQNITRKFIPTIIGITLSWIQNIALLIFLQPVLVKWRDKRWLSFYLPSYLIMLVIIEFALHSSLVPDDAPRHLVPAIISGFLMNSVILMTIELILSRNEATRIKLENADLRMINLQAQHEKLRHQLQPHFLFNSLNALKTLIRRDPVLAEGYLMKLSEFLRFSIAHNKENLVSLDEELKVSLNYLEMQQTRFGNCLLYTIDIPIEIPGIARVPAFSLQLLLENAIKHNALTLQYPLHIHIRYIAPGQLLVENNLRAKSLTEPGTGLGLKNLSERYKMLAQEDIKIISKECTFQVYLTLIFAHASINH